MTSPSARPLLLPYNERWQPGIVEVIKAVYDEFRLTWDPDAYHRDLYTIVETYVDTGGFFTVLVVRGGVIGTVAGLDMGEAAEIERLYLATDYRGRGYGRLMTEHFLDWARWTGHEKVIAWSDKRFDIAHRMYERMGFSLVGDRVLDDPDESPEWGFELSLGPAPRALK
ncbi:MAG: GNAT family N-acetyltransferase [Chloroflexi bacterium]|nr:GNAT family N-acetyltransferase [Chloroflexota bacterium]